MSLEGKKLQEIKVTSARQDQDFPHVGSIFDMKVIDNGNMMLLVLVRAADSFQHPSLVRMDQMGRVVSVSELVLSRRTRADVVLVRIVRTDEQSLFLLGAQAKNALLVKVDNQGNTLWEKTFPHEQRAESFVDGVATKEGGAMLIMQSGADRKGGSNEPPSLRLMRVDATGEVKAEQVFPGRNARIIQTLEGGYAMTYALGQQNAQDAWLQVFDAELTPKWKTPLFSLDFGFSPLLIAPTTDSGFMIATAKRGFRLWIVKVDNGGRLTGEYFEERDPKRLVDSGWVAVKDTFFLLTEMTRSSAKGQILTKIELIRVTTK